MSISKSCFTDGQKPCGGVPRSVLARHYADFSPERLKEIYEKAGLRVLG